MEIRSYAKINLYLEITGMRPDGYHELISLMCAIELADILRLQFDVAGTAVTCPHPEVPEDERNLALKAARLFFRETGINDHIHIFIEKNIPPGAGLGGGSSNAAAVLTALNHHYAAPLSTDALKVLGCQLGADVPFFIDARPAVATGIGECLTPWPHLAPAQILVIYPQIPLSTARVYQNFNFGLTKNKKIPKKNTFRHPWESFPGSSERTKDQEKKQTKKWTNEPANWLYNDLEAPAIEILPVIAEIKQTLMANHATGALMSGSGSAVFGIYPDETTAERAYSEITRLNRNWRVYLSRLRCRQDQAL